MCLLAKRHTIITITLRLGLNISNDKGQMKIPILKVINKYMYLIISANIFRQILINYV